MLKKIISDRKVEIISACVLTLLAILFFSFFAPNPFYGNDELLMRCIANGTYTGKPDGHLVYMMYPLGALLAFLYKIFPAVNWFDLFMLGVHYSVLFIILYRVPSFFKRTYAKLSAAIGSFFVLLIVDYNYFVFQQYTNLAAILVGAALFYLFTGLYRKNLRNIIAPCVLMIIALCVRREVFLMGLPFAALIVFLFVFRAFQERDQDTITKLIKYSVVFCLIVGVCFITEVIAYSSPEWRDYKRYNNARSTMVDYTGIPAYEQVADILFNNDISKEEYVAISKSSFGLSEDLTTEAICELEDRAKAIFKDRYSASFVKDVVKSMLREVQKSLVQPIGSISLLCVLLLCIYSIKNKHYLSIMAGIAALIYECMFIMLFIFKGQFPERVAMALFFMVLSFEAALMLVEINFRYLQDKNSFANSKAKRIAVPTIVIVVMTLAVSFFGYLRTNEISKISDEWDGAIAQNNILSRYFSYNPECVYMLSTQMAGSLADNLFTNAYEDNGNAVYLNFWTLGSPIERRRLENLGIDSCFETLAEYDKAYWVQKGGEDMNWLYSYYASKGYSVSLMLLDSFETESGGNIEIISVDVIR